MRLGQYDYQAPLSQQHARADMPTDADRRQWASDPFFGCTARCVLRPGAVGVPAFCGPGLGCVDADRGKTLRISPNFSYTFSQSLHMFDIKVRERTFLNGLKTFFSDAPDASSLAK